MCLNWSVTDGSFPVHFSIPFELRAMQWMRHEVRMVFVLNKKLDHFGIASFHWLLFWIVASDDFIDLQFATRSVNRFSYMISHTVVAMFYSLIYFNYLFCLNYCFVYYCYYCLCKGCCCFVFYSEREKNTYTHWFNWFETKNQSQKQNYCQYKWTDTRRNKKRCSIEYYDITVVDLNQCREREKKTM